MSEVAVTETDFETWEDCLELSNGTVEVVATTGVGPRIIACGFADGENLFHTDPDQEPVRGQEPFTIHGGHRLWHAPEDPDRTYLPDNDQVEWRETDDGVRLVQPTEPETGIQKTMSVRLAADEPRVEVTHELTNEGLWPVELAPWGITVLRAGGRAVVPFSGEEKGLLPDRSVAFWPYDDLDDDRLSFADDAMLVDQDPDGDGRFKVGVDGADEWAAYVTDGVGFVKTFAYDGDATYPDCGSAIEVYTDERVLELETLGPLRELAPGESAVHTETWHLVDDVADETPAEHRDALAR